MVNIISRISFSNIMYNYSELKEIVEKALINLPYNTETSKLIDPVKYVISLEVKDYGR